MIRVSELKLPLTALPAAAPKRDEAAPGEHAESSPHPLDALQAAAAEKLGITPADIASLAVHKRSFDARKAALLAVFIVDVELADPTTEPELLLRHERSSHVRATPDTTWRPVTPPDGAWPHHERPVVVGFGPCGLFAALALAQMGLRPRVLERGRDVRRRTKDTWGLWRGKTLTPESNVQFGEGGAGLFSDGKLYSQIKDRRGLGRKVMAEFVAAGAPPEILYEAHPHIGTFRLVKVVEAMRETIRELGGTVEFEQRVDGVRIEGPPEDRRVVGVEVRDLADDGERFIRASHVVLALGHSAREAFAMLHDRGVLVEPKPFSLGVRVEHPQSLIDRARWGRHAGHPALGAADYKLVHHASNGRSVYSFCMCPGGTVVAATSEEGRVVTNGMSEYSRKERNANAGLVVGVEPGDCVADEAAWVAAFGPVAGVRYLAEASANDGVHPLAGVVLQRTLEARAFELGGGDYCAPGQLVGDFIAGRPSTEWGDVVPSYRPGVRLTDLADLLPPWVTEAMREALPAFGRKIRGFDRDDAILTGIETRTSSPLRVPRTPELRSVNTAGLYPAGEGAGFAGGILSAGVDGIKVAEALATSLLD